jgi:hypothetical protein
MIHITKIYLVTNCYNDPNKVYIGKTIKSREYAHKKTYGNKIKYTIIDEINSLNRKEWTPLESYWIEQFRQWGFEIMNINKSGGGGPEFHSEETKKKLSCSKPWKEGIFYSDETKLKISKKLKGKSKPNGFGEKVSKSLLGYKRTEQNKINISKALKGKSKSQSTKIKMSLNSKDKNNKPVIQYDKQMKYINEFKSLTDAGLFIGKPKGIGDITACCRGKAKTAYGYIWKYKN